MKQKDAFLKFFIPYASRVDDAAEYGVQLRKLYWELTDQFPEDYETKRNYSMSLMQNDNA